MCKEYANEEIDQDKGAHRTCLTISRQKTSQKLFDTDVNEMLFSSV